MYTNVGDKMRVISGFLKKKEIKGYTIDGTRPTMDRVKESIFGSIQNYINDAVVLDLFSGSGNLGIESISNGANICYYVDNNKIAINTINDNLKNLNIKNNGVVLHKDYKDALKYFKENNIKFDIIFLDPPYAYTVINEILNNLYVNNLLNEDAIVICEYSEGSLSNDNFELLKDKKYGNKYVSIFQKK